MVGGRKDTPEAHRVRARRACLQSRRPIPGSPTTATRLCLALGTDGLRGELILIRAARALASLEGKAEQVGDAELRGFAPMALSHRLRRNSLRRFWLRDPRAPGRGGRILRRMKAPSPGARMGGAKGQARSGCVSRSIGLGPGLVLRSGRGQRGKPGCNDRGRAALPPDVPMRRIPASISDDRLAGGLDVAATIRTGRPVAEPGVLALADGGGTRSRYGGARFACGRDGAVAARRSTGTGPVAPAFPSEAGVRARRAGRGKRSAERRRLAPHFALNAALIVLWI